MFGLAQRLGFGAEFWDGDIDAAYRHVLEPSGVTLDALRALPHGTSVPRAPLQHRRFAEVDPATGAPRGFATPTKKVELFALRFAEHGLPPLPDYVEPALSPVSQPELARDFPLVLTNAKRAQYLHSQHRGLPSLRKTAPNPTAELHPETAARFGVKTAEWLLVETPEGRIRAQAHVTDAVMPGVVCCSHGWWEACPELGLPGFDPFSDAGANQNLLVRNDQHDPVSGGTPHRSTLCRLVRISRPWRRWADPRIHRTLAEGRRRNQGRAAPRATGPHVRRATATRLPSRWSAISASDRSCSTLSSGPITPCSRVSPRRRRPLGV